MSYVSIDTDNESFGLSLPHDITQEFMPEERQNADSVFQHKKR